MVLLKATHIDIENLVESASVAKPYLVYSNKKGNPNLRDSYNIYKDEKVYIRWANKEDKDSVVLLILDEKKTKDIINMSIEARTKGGLTKFENLFYTILQPYIKELNDSIGLKNDVEEKHAPTVSKQSNIKLSVSKPKEPTKVEAKIGVVKEVVKEVDLDAAVKKRFNEKYSYYADRQKAMIFETYIDRDLDYKFEEHKGYALQLLTDAKVRKSYSKLDLDLVTLTLDGDYHIKHYLVPKGCDYLLLGDLNKVYYEKFKVDEKQLDTDIENLFAVCDKLDHLISKINKEQNFEDAKTVFLEIASNHKDDIVGSIKETKDDLVNSINSIRETKFGKFFSKFSKNKNERGFK